jgi:hypothetical protein
MFDHFDPLLAFSLITGRTVLVEGSATYAYHTCDISAVLGRAESILDPTVA